MIDDVADAEARPSRGAGSSPLEPGQVELEGGERLAQFVVDLPRDAGPLLLARRLDPGREGPQLGPRLLQFLRGQGAVGDVALNPEVSGDPAGGVVEAHVVAFDPHRRAVEPPLVGDAVRVAGVEQRPPAAAAGLEVVPEEVARRQPDELRRVRPGTAPPSRD